jgi:hypothetical protein
MNRLIQLLRHFQQAAVAGIGIVAFLVDVEEGDAGFERGVLVAASGDEQVGVGLVDDLKSSWAPPFSIMMPSGPSRALMRALSASVLFLVLVATTLMPRS